MLRNDARGAGLLLGLLLAAVSNCNSDSTQTDSSGNAGHAGSLLGGPNSRGQDSGGTAPAGAGGTATSVIASGAPGRATAGTSAGGTTGTATGGRPSGGANSTATGGVTIAAGTSSTVTGGATAGGKSSATGGVTAGGKDSATGGVAAGGSTSAVTGGAAAGGSSGAVTGGAAAGGSSGAATGGVTAGGGAVATGGVTTGGVASGGPTSITTGGVASGGSLSGTGGSTISGSGGSATGGTPASGGTPAQTGGTAGATTSTGRVADHLSVAAYDSIPASLVAQIAALPMYYGHTSHGSQLISGVEWMDEAYHFTALTELESDLGEDWATPTIAFLNANPNTRVVIWAWCWHLPQYTTEQVQDYLDTMSALELQYPNTQFVYMTAHLRDILGDFAYSDEENQTLQANNNMIRAYCAQHGKWLFDFGDIESYLDGSNVQCMYNEMPTECVWSSTPDGECAHSLMPNCIRKGKAFYWLLARMTGWSG